MTRQKESQLRQHSFFQLRVHLKRGKDLIARDKSGKYTVLNTFWLSSNKNSEFYLVGYFSSKLLLRLYCTLILCKSLNLYQLEVIFTQQIIVIILIHKM